jgi:EEF1A lysine methyltransferase 4
MTVDMHNAGYRNQVSVDFSPKAIDTMKTRHSDLSLQWKVMDVRKMDLEDASFDVAIDKVGSSALMWDTR